LFLLSALDCESELTELLEEHESLGSSSAAGANSTDPEGAAKLFLPRRFELPLSRDDDEGDRKLTLPRRLEEVPSSVDEREATTVPRPFKEMPSSTGSSDKLHVNEERLAPTLEDLGSAESLMLVSHDIDTMIARYRASNPTPVPKWWF
jgi:hypothetical protein